MYKLQRQRVPTFIKQVRENMGNRVQKNPQFGRLLIIKNNQNEEDGRKME